MKIYRDDLSNIKIVDDFSYKYLRSPSAKEFVELGRDKKHVLENFHTYNDFLDFYGYDQPNIKYKYTVYDIDKDAYLLRTNSRIEAQRFISVYNTQKWKNILSGRTKAYWTPDQGRTYHEVKIIYEVK